MEYLMSQQWQHILKYLELIKRQTNIDYMDLFGEKLDKLITFGKHLRTCFNLVINLPIALITELLLCSVCRDGVTSLNILKVCASLFLFLIFCDESREYLSWWVIVKRAGRSQSHKSHMNSSDFNLTSKLHEEIGK